MRTKLSKSEEKRTKIIYREKRTEKKMKRERAYFQIKLVKGKQRNITTNRRKFLRDLMKVLKRTL